MFVKRSVFAVVALATFVSLGTLLFPQDGEAQECVWDCDLGSDFNDFPGENSPGFSIVYCFDQSCVAGLGIFTGAIPNASVKQDASATCPTGTAGMTITISGNVVAVLKDNRGNLKPDSAAEATLSIVINKVNCSGTSPNSTLSRVVSLTEPSSGVIAGNITILAHSSDPNLDAPNWAGSGCPTNKAGILTADCSFPLGIDVSKTDKELSAKFPAGGFFVANGEVYRGIELGRVVAMRMCKGDANRPSSSIACTAGGDVAVGGFVADAVFNFDGNWSGAGDKTFNPKSNTAPFDIITPLFDDIVIATVTASANGGTPIPAQGCNQIVNQETLRCSFPARDLLPNGCTTGQPVNLSVRGNVLWADALYGQVKFLSTDSPTCKN